MHEGEEKLHHRSNFPAVLELNWNFLFGTAQHAVDKKRQHIRHMTELPQEEDVQTIKDYTQKSIAELLNDPFKIWGQRDYIRLRSLLVCHLTLFNSRRGGEPCTLTVQEWQDAAKD